MFHADEARLRQRQLALRLRSAELRAALHRDCRALQPVVDYAERGLKAWGWLQGLPRLARLLPLAGLVLLLRRPSRASRLAGWALSGLRWWRLLRQFIDPSPPPPRT